MTNGAARGGSPLLWELRTVVGPRHVLTGERRTRRFRTGYRTGSGPVLAVVRPGTLVEFWRVLRVCVAARVIVIVQAANTGLTGGSTPDGEYDRGVVLISTLRLDRIRLLGGGRQALCFPGATLDHLERLLKPLGREPHSVIGSSCLGASVIGGVANNSGGSLVRRGPTYTELALYARVDGAGHLELVDELGLVLGNDAETMLQRLDEDRFEEAEIRWDRGAGHDGSYPERVRDVDADTPSRFNADPGRLYGAAGSAGRVAILAVRVDSFPAETDPATFYLGTNDPGVLERLRRRLLRDLPALPIAGEYMHRDAFDLCDRFGKDTVVAIERLGTPRLPKLFAAKAAADRLSPVRGLSDRMLQLAGRCFPDHLPKRMRTFRDRFEHSLVLKVGGAEAAATAAMLREELGADGDWFRCTKVEASKAFLHRFAAAGAGVRMRALDPKRVPDIVALDIALRRNDAEWFERLPPEFDALIAHRIYYGHFLCHVMHQDYVPRPGVDPMALKKKLLAELDRRGARYPAEHNVGHLYAAGVEQVAHFRELDPCNCFNPGIGHTSRRFCWGEAA